MSRRVLVALAAVSGVLALGTAQFSSAAYTSQSASTATVAASSDWTRPTVTVSAPATATGTVTVTATATDAESGIASVQVQVRPAGGDWTTVCTRTGSSATCSYDTTAGADGTSEVRALATDAAGNTGTSDVARVTVANRAAVTLARPASVVRGAVALSASASTSAATDATVRLERSPAGAGTWTTVCGPLSAPYTCTWATTGVANGSYDLRAVLVSGTTVLATSGTERVLVDNAAPSVTLTNPGTPLSGTRTFATTATDAHSGVAEVAVQYSSGTSWTTLCTATAAPWSCTGDTRTIPNGTYSFRAVATDVAGNTATSAAVTGRAVSNVVSTVVLADPGATLRGSVTLTATATSTGTIAKVVVQRSPAGAGTWTDVCTDTTAPYSCALDTTRLAEGAYDLRAVLTDTQGGTVTSAVVADRTVDNVPPRGYDVQTTNGGAPGRIDAGDTMSFTFSERIDLGSVLAGWDGSAVAVQGRVTDDWGFRNNTFQVVGRSATVRLGSVQLNEDFTILFGNTVNGTLTAETVTVDGVARTVVTVRIESSGGFGMTTVDTAAAMEWTPASGVTDLAGNPIDTAVVTERGSLDRDF
jgi:hypothetical protein